MPDINDHIRDIVNTEVRQLRARADSLEVMATALDQDGEFVGLIYTVSIDDPWDAAANIGDKRSCREMSSTLKAAVEGAEREYARRGGGRGALRTDGVLRYYVHFELAGKKFPVPEELWLQFSEQDAANYGSSAESAPTVQAA